MNNISRALIIGLLTITTNSFCQGSLSTISPLYRVVDSIATKDGAGRMFRLYWMDSLIEVRKTVNLKYNLAEARKWEKDSTYLPTPKDTMGSYQRSVTASQNCHSYALEKYFISAGVENKLFTRWTVLTENRYMEKILVNSFEKISSQPIKHTKCKECTFTAGSILVLRDKWNFPIHTVYYDGEFFHSKYGAWAAKADKSINVPIKRYWDSKTVDEYRLDFKKINAFLTAHKSP